LIDVFCDHVVQISEIHVLPKSATVKYQEVFERTYRSFRCNLFLGCIVKESVFLRIARKVDRWISFWSLLSKSKLKKLPRYLNGSPLFIGGTTSELIRSLGWSWREWDENFLIPKVVHLSPRITILAYWHHLQKQFDINWFSCSYIVTTTASSTNWNQWTGCNKWSFSSCGEQPNCLYFSFLTKWMFVLKHKLNIRVLRQFPWSTPCLMGIAGDNKLSEIFSREYPQ